MKELMDEKIDKPNSFTRRDFLKVGGITIASAMLLNVLASCSLDKTVTETFTTTKTVTDTAPPVTSGPTSFVFTDSLGRKVEVPANITKIAVSGSMAQIVLFALCPDKLVGIASAWDAAAKQFLDEKYYNLPVLGQFYVGSGSGNLSMEEIAKTGAQILIDVGDVKANHVADMNTLQSQLGIPAVHIDAYTAAMAHCYRMLGELLNMPEEADAIAKYCDKVYGNTISIANRVTADGTKAKLLYVTGSEGLNVIAKNSYHAEILDILSNNLAVVSNPSSSGNGNAVGMEQILIWSPETIIFAPNSIYSTVGSKGDWSTIPAIKNGKYYEVPFGPYNWMGSPPSVQRYLGMIWMAQLLYPEAAQYNVYNEVQEYFKLFYHCDITRAQYDALVANSLGKK
ncbi:MAG: ABC transporter substrate-binding protein [Dehalococcoidia bacterium]|nr:ABC transporter substrate-binding protein [Dehalococcoidia bacterium]